MKKLRLYLHELLDDPVVSYPAWYLLSPKLHRDENLRETLRKIHAMEFDSLAHPAEPSEIFSALRRRSYPIYLEKYAVGYFGGRVMYLESGGWKSMPLSEEAFEMANWLLEC